MANCVRWVLAIQLLMFLAFGPAAAQITELREIDGKMIACTRSGLWSDLNDCGTQKDWYAYVFVGSITTIVPANKDEKKLQITPEEVFQGEPMSPLTILTSQGECLPKMAVGDRWLFWLRQEPGKPIVLGYGGGSLPLAEAEKQIETLRRLQTIGDFGILRGSVLRGASHFERKPVPGMRVVASRTSDRAQFVAITDARGYYEFQPLPVGKYELSADSIGLFYEGDAAIEVSRGACWDVALWKSPEPPHTRLSGHVKRSDGAPVSEVPILIVREDGSWFTTEKSDADGHFQEDSLSPGRYIVGINLPGALPWKVYSCAGACKSEIPKASLYYPGMHNRSDALVITLNDNEKRDDIDFNLSDQ
jgi:Carboxypeptidase regulatory-like domain